MEETIKLVLTYSSVFGSLITIITFVTLVLSRFIKPLGGLIGRLWAYMVKRAINYSDIMDGIDRATESINKLATMLERNAVEDRKSREEIITRLDLHSEALMETLGNTIKRIYDNHKTAKKLSVAEKSIMERMYLTYASLGGNHEIKIMYQEMQSWDVY